MAGYNLGLLRAVHRWARHPDGPIKFSMLYWAETPADGRFALEQGRPADVVPGTVMCLGGYAVWRRGCTFLWQEDAPGGIVGHGEAVYSCRLPSSGRVEKVRDAAQRFLGLTDEEAEVLFCMGLDHPAELSLDFLNLLRGRAARRDPNLTPDQVSAWTEEWVDIGTSMTVR